MGQVCILYIGRIFFTYFAVVCVKSCPKKTDYSEFICYDEKQAAANANESTAWVLVGKQKCMYEAKTEECQSFCSLYVS